MPSTDPAKRRQQQQQRREEMRLAARLAAAARVNESTQQATGPPSTVLPASNIHDRERTVEPAAAEPAGAASAMSAQLQAEQGPAAWLHERPPKLYEDFGGEVGRPGYEVARGQWYVQHTKGIELPPFDARSPADVRREQITLNSTSTVSCTIVGNSRIVTTRHSGVDAI